MEHRGSSTRGNGRGRASLTVPVIVGPTASGKTALSLGLVDRIGRVEIVSADSRQVYRGLDIGTAKPTPAELAAAPHHLIDIVSPDELYSAGRYADDARRAISGIIERGRVPLVVGGSGFYIRALFHGLGAPAVDQEIYDRLLARAESEGYDLIFEELQRVDPRAAAAHSPNNRVKLLRALACYHQTGTPYSEFEEGNAFEGAFTPLYIGIAPPRPELYRRIDDRVLEMMRLGLIDETRALLHAGYRASDSGMKTVGYAETIAHLEGRLGYSETVAAIQQSSRRYAKRQMTWFRRIESIHWSEAPDLDAATRLLDSISHPKS